jgi:hypothetical protein
MEESNDMQHLIISHYFVGNKFIIEQSRRSDHLPRPNSVNALDPCNNSSFFLIVNTLSLAQNQKIHHQETMTSSYIQTHTTLPN